MARAFVLVMPVRVETQYRGEPIHCLLGGDGELLAEIPERDGANVSRPDRLARLEALASMINRQSDIDAERLILSSFGV